MKSMSRRNFLVATLATLAYTACTPASQPSAPAKTEPAKPAESKPAEAKPAAKAESKPAESKPAESKPAAPAAPKGDLANKVVFWHAMGGVNGEAVNKMVDSFNKSQSQIQVEAVFQGTYDDALAKLKTALASNSAPALIQVYDIGLRFMQDSGEVVPMQQYIDAEKFDVSDFEPNVLAYYQLDNKLIGMPFNTSSSILYYNKDAFKAAGLDPEKPPKTFDEVTEYAKKLTKRDGNTVSQYGFHQAIYGWLFEQYMAVSGGLYVDNGNGRDAKATKAVYNDDKGKTIMDWWKAGVEGGYFGNFGRVTNDNAAAFDAGRSAMYCESTARMRGHINNAQGKFEVGTGFYPRPANSPREGGNIIGGASVYLLKSRPEPEQRSAWEFVKYISSPAVQAQWQVDTGYYPMRKAAYNEAAAKEWVAKFPQFNTAVEQIRAVPVNRITQGAVFGVFPQARQRIETAIEQVLLGQADSKTALDQAAEEITSAIDRYNKSTG
jgi:sn-glycerol 3-phosphate transport system substrate-binding protein